MLRIVLLFSLKSLFAFGYFRPMRGFLLGLWLSSRGHRSLFINSNVGLILALFLFLFGSAKFVSFEEVGLLWGETFDCESILAMDLIKII